MDVGIIGAGRLGQAMARTALRAGRQVVLANSRGPESLASLVSTLGERTSAGTVDEAAGAGIVVIAVPWPRVPEAVQGLHWDGRIVIDATNDFDPSDLNGRTSSQVLADLVPGARVVKADCRGDLIGKHREPAGHEYRVRAIGSHGLHESPPARGEHDTLVQNAIDDFVLEAAQQRDTFAQSRLELDLATHRPLRDR